MNNLFMPKEDEQKELKDVIIPKAKKRPLPDNTLVFATATNADSKVYAVPFFDEAPVLLTQRPSTVFGLEHYDGVVYDGGIYGMNETLTNAMVHSSHGQVNSLCFFDGGFFKTGGTSTSHDGNFVFELLQNRGFGAYTENLNDMCHFDDFLYVSCLDSIHRQLGLSRNKVFNPFFKQYGDGDIISCIEGFGNTLYASTGVKIHDVFGDKVLDERNNWMTDFCVHENRLIDVSSDGVIRDTLTCKELFSFPEVIVTMVSVPTKILEDYLNE